MPSVTPLKRIHMDNNATTPVDPVVLESMMPFLGVRFGNPSSLHEEGRIARAALDDARDRVAQAVGCPPREIVFTSGGTESNTLALRGVVRKALVGGKKTPVHIVTTRVEHSSILETVRLMEEEGLVAATFVGVDSRGRLNLAELESALTQETVLVSVMAVNNEIGNIYPIEEIGRLTHLRGILFHVDACQALGKIRLNLKNLPVDLASFSAHKISGPKGVGALSIRQGAAVGAIQRGGAQEFEKRGGTENLPGIVGFGTAITQAHGNLETESTRVGVLRDRLEQGFRERISGVHMHGDLGLRVSNTLNVSFEGIARETILVAMDRAGIAASAGSACASGALEPSHVLLAMGLDRAFAKGAVRFSLGRSVTEPDIDSVIEIMTEIVKRLRS